MNIENTVWEPLVEHNENNLGFVIGEEDWAKLTKPFRVVNSKNVPSFMKFVEEENKDEKSI